MSATGSGTFSTVVAALDVRAASSPQALAFDVCGQPATYRALRDQVARLAAALAARGLERGGRCALALPTGLPLVGAIFAVQALGAAPVVLSHALPPGLTAARARVARCHMLLTTAASARAHEHARRPGGADAWTVVTLEAVAAEAAAPIAAFAELVPDDLAYVQLTSGTTGEPRAVPIAYRHLMPALEASASFLQVGPDDVFCGWVPAHHDLGLVRFVLAPVFFGCPAYLLEPSIRGIMGWMQTAARVRATITGGPDFGYRLAARRVDPSGLDLRALRYATNGGEPVRLSTIERFEARFGLRGVVRPGYGLAEATLGVTTVRAGEPLVCDARGNVSCGRPVPGVAVQIADERGRPQPSGVPGEVCIRGAPVFDGYDGDAAGERFRDGWFYTGDIGACDDAGNLTLLGRKRALIKRAGALISPREVEEAADAVPGVRASAAIGQPSGGEGATEDLVVVAEIRGEESSSAADLEALAAHVSAAVTRFIGFAPAEVVLLRGRTLPRTRNGKTRYAALRAALADGSLARGGAILHGPGAVA